MTVGGQSLRVSSLDRVLYPATGTKVDVLDCYTAFARRSSRTPGGLVLGRGSQDVDSLRRTRAATLIEVAVGSVDIAANRANLPDCFKPTRCREIDR